MLIVISQLFRIQGRNKLESKPWLIEELKKEYQDVSWDKLLCEGELPEELKSFIDTYLKTRKELKKEIKSSEVE